jgi:hypothetical protein
LAEGDQSTYVRFDRYFASLELLSMPPLELMCLYGFPSLARLICQA